MADAWETEYGVTSRPPTRQRRLDEPSGISGDSNPNVADTDGDSLSDAYEVNVSRTNPRIADDNLALFGNGIIGIFDNVTNNIDCSLLSRNAAPPWRRFNDGLADTRSTRSTARHSHTHQLRRDCVDQSATRD
jgi:hypothetical protein